MKKHIRDISAIVLLAIFSALVYNFFSSKPLALIKEKEILAEVSDSLLFENNSEFLQKNIESTDTLLKITENKKDSTKLKRDTVKIKDTKVVKDSLKHESKTTITFSQMKKIINNPNFLIIDARNADTYGQGHIGNSINLHPYWEPNDYFPKITNLPKDKTIIIYCDGGNCELSHKVEADLKNFGYDKVFVYVGGWEDWKKNGGK